MTNYKFELSNGYVMEFDAEADRVTRYIDALYQGHISRLWIDEVEYQKQCVGLDIPAKMRCPFSNK